MTKSASWSSTNSALGTTSTRTGSHRDHAPRSGGRGDGHRSRHQAIDGDQDEGYCRVMWSPAADGRGPDGYIPLGNVISNPRATSTRPPVTAFSAQTAAILQRRREENGVAPVPEGRFRTLLRHLPPSKRLTRKETNALKNKARGPFMDSTERTKKEDALVSSSNNWIEKKGTLCPEKTKRENALLFCLIIELKKKTLFLLPFSKSISISILTNQPQLNPPPLPNNITNNRKENRNKQPPYKI